MKEEFHQLLLHYNLAIETRNQLRAFTSILSTSSMMTLKKLQRIIFMQNLRAIKPETIIFGINSKINKL